jgi:hypothetical protein
MRAADSFNMHALATKQSMLINNGTTQKLLRVDGGNHS